MTRRGRSSKPKEHTIKLSISLGDDIPVAKVKTSSNKTKAEKTKPIFNDEADLLKLANLVKKTGERNTEHGKTFIQTIDFREDSQRRKIIRLLMDHYSEIVWKMLPYLRNLGGHPRAEIRRRVSETVGELMCEDFIRVKEDVLMHWAMHGSAVVNANVGLALAVVSKDSRYEGNVKSLLYHWVKASNPDLNWTAMASCVPLCSLWPDEILGFVEKSLDRGQVELLALAIFVVRELCRSGSEDKVIQRLAEWIRSDREKRALRTAAALVFLEAIVFDDVGKNRACIDKTVEIYKVGLDDRNLDNMGFIRAALLDKLREWALSASAKKSSFDTVEKLFTRLYLRSDERGRQRLIFNVERWSHAKDKQSEIFVDLLDGLKRKDK